MRVLCLLFPLLLPMAVQSAITASSSTTFQGRITVSTCNIVVGDDDQTVSLGEISTAELNAAGKSTPVPFYIRLYGCSAANRTVRTLFDQTGQGASGTVIPVTGVSGIGLSLQDSAGNPIIFGQRTAGQKIQLGENSLLYTAHIVKTGTLQAGSFHRLLHYTLTYD